MNRRHLLRTVALVPVAALVACNAANIQTVTKAVVNDVSLIASGLQGALPQFATVTGISTAQLATITGEVNAIVIAAGQVVEGIAANLAQPIVQQIGADFSTLQSAAAGLNLPDVLKTILAAAQVLLPVIETAVGIFVAAAPAGGMTPARARAVLAAAR